MAKLFTVLLLVLLSLLAVATVAAWLHLRGRDPVPERASRNVVAAMPSLDYAWEPIGAQPGSKPAILHVTVADPDGDNLQDVLGCDAALDRVVWLRQAPRGAFTETALGDRVRAPAKLVVSDVTHDGRPDVVVASLGDLRSTDDRIGRVVLLENAGEGRFNNRVLIEHVARVTDVQVADFDGDGRSEIVFSLLGRDEPGIRWLRRAADGSVQEHRVPSPPGVVALRDADFNADGKPDLAALIARPQVEVQIFLNRGDGGFAPTTVWTADRNSSGGSGLEVSDLNGDRRPDLLLTQSEGVYTESLDVSPRDSLSWLENREERFLYHRIGAMPGAHSPIAVDLDRDGDLDVVAVSPFNQSYNPETLWLAGWINDGASRFAPTALALDADRLYSVAAGDLDGSGAPVLVTGAAHLRPPYERVSRVTLWRHP